MTLPQSNSSFAAPPITPADAAPLQHPLPTPSQREAIANEILGAPSGPAPRDAAPSMLTSQALFAAIAIAAGVALLGWAAWQGTRRARRGALRANPAAAIKPDASLRAPAPAPDPRAAELLAAAQSIAQQLDARAAQLERTLHAANARIAQLEQSSVPHAATPPTTPHTIPHTTHRAAVPAAPTPQLHEPKPRDPAAAPFANHRDIYDLADQGMTPVQIAQKLSKPTGQIELILNLRKASHASAS